VKVPVTVVQPTAMEGIMANMVYLVIGIIVIIAAGYYLLVMRKKK
jgi:LPXTG-motif cell wall-anchored protein